MASLKELLTFIYSEKTAADLIIEIDELVKKYQSQSAKRQFEITEKDVLLITYGDTLHSSNKSGLYLLKAFLDRFLKDKITLVHLLPFFPYSSDDGFSVIDYYKVNPSCGSWDEIVELSKAYHLMFDGVINHISKESDWVKQYLDGKRDFENYFVDADPTADYTKVTRPRTLPLLHEYKATDGAIKNLWTTFSEDQIDLNYENPRVLLHILDVLLFYQSMGAKLLRLDAIGFMWKQLGTSCIHLPETHALIQVMRQVLEKVDEDIVLITETNVPHQENISYFGDGTNEAKMVYNFTLPPLMAYSLLSENTSKLTKWASSLHLPSDQVCFFNFTASHDGVGLRPIQGILSDAEVSVLMDAVAVSNGKISYRTSENGKQVPYELNCNYLSLLSGKYDALGEKRFLLSQAIMLCMPGLPAIYIHSLIGSENDLEGVEATGRNRSINRQKLSYRNLRNELNKSFGLRHDIMSAILQIIEYRKQLSCFHPFATFSFSNYGDKLFAIERFSQQKDQHVTAIFNCSHSLMPLPQTLAGLKDVFPYSGPSETILPFSFRWLKH